MKCEMDQCKGSPCFALSAARCGGDSTFMGIYTPAPSSTPSPILDSLET